MLQERLIRLAEDHSIVDYSNDASVSRANAVADTIREFLNSASEVELIESLKFSPVKSWVAFYVMESPKTHSTQLADLAFLEIEEIANGDGLKSSAAREILDRLKEKGN